MMNNIPTVRFFCDGCGSWEDIEMIQISKNEPRLYRVPFGWEFDWHELEDGICCDNCWIEGDTPSETLSAAERNPSLCK